MRGSTCSGSGCGARRLLLALFLALAGTYVLAAVVLPGDAPTLRGDSLAALGYVMNWHLIFGGQSYFDPMVRPTLLQHLWSLAVEEQFYLLWPLLAMRLALVLGLAELSYRFVETPIRRGAIERAWRAFMSTRRAPAPRGASLAHGAGRRCRF
jgi:peptidoglycan/LPS O-acetylase OafA/YrhL